MGTYLGCTFVLSRLMIFGLTKKFRDVVVKSTSTSAVIRWFVILILVLWMRIRLDQHHLPDLHTGPADPDPYPFQPIVNLNYTFFQKILIFSLKIMKLLFDTEKDKTGTAVD